jgi:hypothetical protein
MPWTARGIYSMWSSSWPNAAVNRLIAAGREHGYHGPHADTRLAVPHPSLLAIAGAGLAFLPFAPQIRIKPELRH